MCVCRLTGLVECVEESEGLRRDGAWEHGVLQERAAGEAPLHEPPHVSLLILLAPAQANTRLEERQRVRTVAQVRGGMSYDGRLCLLPNLVSLRMVKEAARREYTSVDGGKSIISTFLCFFSCCTHTYPSKHIYVDSGKYRGLVRLGLLYSQFLCVCVSVSVSVCVCVCVCVCKHIFCVLLLPYL